MQVARGATEISIYIRLYIQILNVWLKDIYIYKYLMYDLKIYKCLMYDLKFKKKYENKTRKEKINNQRLQTDNY